MYWNEFKPCSIKSAERLTLTWDVLKCYINRFKRRMNKININMRCIEIAMNYKYKRSRQLININMRCIEINYLSNYRQMRVRLTLAWDVLKSFYRLKYIVYCWININMRCIEIWNSLVAGNSKGRININMRCIEMGKITIMKSVLLID